MQQVTGGLEKQPPEVLEKYLSLNSRLMIGPTTLLDEKKWLKATSDSLSARYRRAQREVSK